MDVIWFLEADKFTSMGRSRRDCPVCYKKGLVRLPNHLRTVHGLDPQKVMASLSTDEGIAETEDEIEAETEDEIEAETEDETEGETETETEDEDEEDTSVWFFLVSPIFEQFEDDMNARVKELAEDVPIEEAQETTVAEFLPAMNKKLQKELIKFSRLSHRLKKDPLYQKLMATAKRGRQEDEMDWEESVAYAVQKLKFLLDKVLQNWTPAFACIEMNEDSE